MKLKPDDRCWYIFDGGKYQIGAIQDAIYGEGHIVSDFSGYEDYPTKIKALQSRLLQELVKK